MTLKVPLTTSRKIVVRALTVQAENLTDIRFILPTIALHLPTIALQLDDLGNLSPRPTLQSGQEGRSVLPQVNYRDDLEWTDTSPRARGVTLLLPSVSAIVVTRFTTAKPLNLGRYSRCAKRRRPQAWDWSV
jgi:hypothetical protein